jgi:DNA adenine methylase
MARSNLSTVPFLKWAGGKRWLAAIIRDLFADFKGTYFEPFLGGGAVFFRLAPERAILSDVNEDLVHTFRMVRDRPEEVIAALAKHRIGRVVFQRVRSADPTDGVSRAVRLLYLNRTAFNGLYRVNRQGRFNVPFGCKPGTVLCDAAQIRACSSALSTADLISTGFDAVLRRVRKGQCVYADPPFTTKHNNNAFRRYNESLFSWADQLRLATLANAAAERGARVIVSNALHPEVLSLYPRDLFVPCGIRRASCLAADPMYRSHSTELLLVSKTVAASVKQVRCLLSRRDSNLMPVTERLAAVR